MRPVDLYSVEASILRPLGGHYEVFDQSFHFGEREGNSASFFVTGGAFGGCSDQISGSSNPWGITGGGRQ